MGEMVANGSMGMQRRERNLPLEHIGNFAGRGPLINIVYSPSMVTPSVFLCCCTESSIGDPGHMVSTKGGAVGFLTDGIYAIVDAREQRRMSQ